MSNHRALGCALIVNELDESVSLFECRCATVLEGKAQEGETSGFVNWSIGLDVQQRNNGTNAGRVKSRQIIVVGVQRTAPSEAAFDVDVGHAHTSQNAGDDPPERAGFVASEHAALKDFAAAWRSVALSGDPGQDEGEADQSLLTSAATRFEIVLLLVEVEG